MFNPYLVIPILTWAIAQLIKFCLRAFRGQLDPKLLIGSGGMPSAHSAVVVSLAVTTLILLGVRSPLFGIVTVIAGIVIYDSFGVRRASGEQGVAINQILASLSRGPVASPPLREVLGHKPREVIVGVLLGALTGILFNASHLAGLGHLLQATPVGWEWRVYLIFGVVFILGGLAQRLILGRKSRPVAWRSFAKRVFAGTQIAGWLLVLLNLSEFEAAGFLAWRVWANLVLAAGVIWLAWFYVKSRRPIAEALAAESETKRRRFWLTPKRKKRRRK